MISDIVEELRNSHQSYFGSDLEPEIRVVQTMSYPNSSIARLSVRWGGEQRSLFVKLLDPDQIDGRSNRSGRGWKEQQVQGEYAVLRKLYHDFGCYSDLGVIKPVACFQRYLALVTEEQAGVKLSSMLGKIKVYSTEDSIRRLVQWIHCCGKWLRCFQEATRQTTDQRYVPKEVLDYCDIRLDILGRYCPREFRKEFCGRIRRFLKDQIERSYSREIEITGRHNDYTPHNMLISGEKLIVLDFAGFNYGPVCSDYVKLWASLDLMRGDPLVPGETVTKLEEAFARGYGRTISSDNALFRVFHVAYMLDKMGDIWLDWATIPWIKRPLYKQLYRRYLVWLEDHC